MPKQNVADRELEEGLLSGTRKHPTRFLRARWTKMAGVVLILAVCAFALSSAFATSIPSGIHSTTPVFPISVSEQKNWGQYSPYFPLAEYQAPPKGCEITQVRSLPLIVAIRVHTCVG